MGFQVPHDLRPAASSPPWLPPGWGPVSSGAWDFAHAAHAPEPVAFKGFGVDVQLVLKTLHGLGILTSQYSQDGR